MKKINKAISLTLIASSIFAPISSFAYASEPTIFSNTNYNVVTPMGTTTPAFYEHKYEEKYITPDEVDKLYDYARKYDKSGTVNDLLGLFSFVAGFFPELSIASTTSSVASYMKSDIKSYNIVCVAYDLQREMRGTGWTERNTGFHFKRFFNGDVMGKWYLSDIYDATNF